MIRKSTSFRAILYLLISQFLLTEAWGGLIGFDAIQSRFVAVETRGAEPDFGIVSTIGVNPFDSASTVPLNFSSLVYDSRHERLLGVHVMSGIDSLYEINPVTGESILLGRILVDGISPLFSDINGLALDPISGSFFATAAAGLFRLDASNGNVTFVATIDSDVPGLGFNLLSFASLTFDTSTNTLFGVGSLGGRSSLHSIDVNSGVATSIGDFGFRNISSLAYDPTTDDLYAFLRNGPTGNEFISLDHLTGQPTVITSGVATSMESGFTGLTVGPINNVTVPEPTSAIAFGVLLAAISASRKRRWA